MHGAGSGNGPRWSPHMAISNRSSAWRRCACMPSRDKWTRCWSVPTHSLALCCRRSARPGCPQDAKRASGRHDKHSVAGAISLSPHRDCKASRCPRAGRCVGPQGLTAARPAAAPPAAAGLRAVPGGGLQPLNDNSPPADTRLALQPLGWGTLRRAAPLPWHNRGNYLRDKYTLGVRVLRPAEQPSTFDAFRVPILSAPRVDR